MATGCLQSELKPASRDVSSVKAVGGGTGYDGKIYVNLDKENLCPDGTHVRSKVEVTEAGSHLVRDNCSQITPQAVSTQELNLYSFNLSNAVLNGRVFDLRLDEQDPNSTQWLCRGQQVRKPTGEPQYADVIIRHVNLNPLAESARVIMAVYNTDGTLKAKLDSDFLKLRNITTEVEGRVKYVTPIVGRFGITLWIDKEGYPKTGKLSFIELPYEGRDKEPDYNFRDYERVIQNLTCYTH